MKRCLAVATVLLALATIGERGLQACGDKFFLVGRGDRFARAYASLHPGRIVIYTGGSTATSNALGDGRLQKYFSRAGHQVSVAHDMAALDQTLRTADIDLVIAGLTEALDLLPHVDSTVSRPTLLPVADDTRDAPQVQHQFAATLKTSDKINGFLAKIENVMKKRSAAPARQTR
jgi:hypothetical protein